MKRVHLIGIGGTGLSAIALVLMQKGIQVSGSDRQLSPLVESLQAAGVHISIGHSAENVQGADLVIRSSAIPDHNVEVLAAQQAGIPVLKRSEFLESFMGPKSGYDTIAVAGTHGKTTTTAMVAWMLVSCGMDPSYIIGSTSLNLGSNAHAGADRFFVIEADEYDSMFLGLSPRIAVVTNIEHDHPDCYPTPQDFFAAFSAFTQRILPGGILIACADEPGASRLLQEAGSHGIQTIAYGLVSPNSDWIGCRLAVNSYGAFDFECYPARVQVAGRGQGGLPSALSEDRAAGLKVSLQVPGEHNVRNALAALAVAACLELPLEAASRSLGSFQGCGRRFEVVGEAKGITLIDDYAHHPTEIRATLAAARARFPGRRIWAVWQPHTYSRTRTLAEQFASAFADADRVIITPIYAARENPPADGYSASQLQQAVANMSRLKAEEIAYIPDLQQVSERLLAQIRCGDVVLVLSAGDADQINVRLREALQPGGAS